MDTGARAVGVGTFGDVVGPAVAGQADGVPVVGCGEPEQIAGGVPAVEGEHTQVEALAVHAADVEQAGFELLVGQGVGEVGGEQVQGCVSGQRARCGRGHR